MAVLHFRQVTPVAGTVYTASEMGRGFKNAINPLVSGAVAVVGAMGGETIGASPNITYDYNIPRVGTIVVPPNGIAMNDREFAAMQPSIKMQLAYMIDKGFISADLDGAAQTSAQIRVYA